PSVRRGRRRPRGRRLAEYAALCPADCPPDRRRRPCPQKPSATLPAASADSSSYPLSISFILGADAVHMVQRADEDLPARDRRRGIALLAQLIPAHHLELRPGLQHPGSAVVVQKEQVVADRHR